MPGSALAFLKVPYGSAPSDNEKKIRPVGNLHERQVQGVCIIKNMAGNQSTRSDLESAWSESDDDPNLKEETARMSRLLAIVHLCPPGPEAS